MMKIFKDNMTAEAYKIFETDYNLYICIKTSITWKNAISDRDKSIFIKTYFDRLINKYNYTEYKENIIKCKSIHSIIQAEIKEKDLSYADCLYIHYTIQTYLGFLIEYVIKQEMQKRYNITCISNDYLDYEKKTDILCGGVPYQIKNYSFIDNNYYLNKRLSIYKNACNALRFIFYITEIDNIYIAKINNTPLIDINTIDDFTVVINKTTKITLDELLSSMMIAAL